MGSDGGTPSQETFLMASLYQVCWLAGSVPPGAVRFFILMPVKYSDRDHGHSLGEITSFLAIDRNRIIESDTFLTTSFKTDLSRIQRLKEFYDSVYNKVGQGISVIKRIHDHKGTLTIYIDKKFDVKNDKMILHIITKCLDTWENEFCESFIEIYLP